MKEKEQNAKKEYGIKVLSEEGLKISRTKIQSVLDFPLPTVEIGRAHV